MIYNLIYSISDVIHPLHPQHLILILKLFSNTLVGGKLLHQFKKHALCLLVQIGQITVQLAGGQQLVPNSVLFVVDVLFHDVILQIRLIPAIQSFWLITKSRREATSLRSASLRRSFFINKTM